MRRYRQSRDLTAAMRLRLDEEDEADSLDGGSSNISAATDDSCSDRDSVISASTRVTPSEAESSSRRGRARGGRATVVAAPPSSSGVSLESEEVGYGSDRENRPEPFARPAAPSGSKLMQPKVYPASSSATKAAGGVSTRSRSSSRNRNPLGSSN